ncbi:nicotinate-nucleotide adenylyltransferase [Desulfonema magnum]|uniref:Probable nicotinate-nucleotide adenylyltransferase n=1 Tax=Desulfonema magnum TaxID=45655 RepID=A0A975BNH4_9BACT|nr:nicotinate-nucleotide adenylyltransferase [Desulfonema magnum]QTA88792.1 Nicotinate-nucleotide adenylyltransferase [Desulfonema magnum]
MTNQASSFKFQVSSFKSLGLFGGTFNPIHLGHLRAAQEVKDGFGLDKICLIPSAIPPHKSPEGIVDAENRLEMIRLAVSDCPDFMVSDVELKRSGPSYTIDTVRYFKSVLPEDARPFFIIGLDAFLEMDIWKSYKELFLRIPFIVMARPGGADASPTYLRKRWKLVETFLKSRISDGYQFSDSRRCYVHAEKQPVYIFDATLLDISATKIRKLVKQRKSIRFLTPEKVEKFIQTKGFFL